MAHHFGKADCDIILVFGRNGKGANVQRGKVQYFTGYAQIFDLA